MQSLFGAGSTATWVIVVASGVFHGVNPAMGWLFATALGLQRGRLSAVLLALPPLALGHAASILLFASSATVLAAWTSGPALRLGLGLLLIGWAGYQQWNGHRHRPRVGMTAGFGGLAAWSAAMATTHGAGLMLWPALLPLCGTGSAGTAPGWLVPLAFAALHAATTLVTTGVIAVAAYAFLGLGVLRRGWINFDWLWCGALAMTGVALSVSA